MTILLWLKEIRAPFLTASILPVLLGTGYAYFQIGIFNLSFLLLSLLAMVCIHIGANLANEYFDFQNGTDKNNTQRTPFSGGSGLLPAGTISPSSVYRASLAFFLIGGLLGFYLTLLRGPVLLALGLAGIFSAYFYTSPKINLARLGLGELAVGLSFGVLPVFGSYFVQTGIIHASIFLVSLPLAFLITAVLYINQFPDYDADKGAGKRNIVVRLGREKAVKGFGLLILFSYFSLIGGVIIGMLPLLSLVGLLTLPLAVKSFRILKIHHSSFPAIIPANASTVMNHLFFGLLLTASLFLA